MKNNLFLLEQSFTQNGVIFEDGSSKDFDVVVKCTGYVIDIPFLPDSIKSKVTLFKIIVSEREN